MLIAGSGLALTTLALIENAFKGAPSYALCKRRKATDASAASLSNKTLQLLHASGHGKFTTGRSSSTPDRAPSRNSPRKPRPLGRG